MIRDIITAFLLLGGSTFMLLAGVGILRLPDLYIRMHAATKSGTLGVAGVIAAVAVYFGDLGVTTRSILIILFFLLTAPVAAHMIARAAYTVGVPLWEKSLVDELQPHYRPETGVLEGAKAPPVTDEDGNDTEES